MKKAENLILGIIVLVLVWLLLNRDKVMNLGENLSYGQISADPVLAGRNCADLNRAIEQNNGAVFGPGTDALGLSTRAYDHLRQACGLPGIRIRSQSGKTPSEYDRLLDLIERRVQSLNVLPHPALIDQREDVARRLGITYQQAVAIEAAKSVWDESAANRGRSRGKIIERILLEKFGVVYDYTDF